MSMTMTLLGTGSPLPDPNRAGPSIAVRAGGTTVVIDAGRGVVMRLAGAGITAPTIDALLLTHLHSDHTQDFTDIVTTRWVMLMENRPLSVIGPVGTAEFVERCLAMMATDIEFRMAHHDDLGWGPECTVEESEGGIVFNKGGLVVRAALVDHKPVRGALGFRFEYGGKILAISGDTGPCAGLDELCGGADVYVQNVLRRSLIEKVPAQRLRDILSYHSSCEDAGATAARSGVRKLVLSHHIPPPLPGHEASTVDEVRSGGFDGEIVVGDDLMEIKV